MIISHFKHPEIKSQVIPSSILVQMQLKKIPRTQQADLILFSTSKKKYGTNHQGNYFRCTVLAAKTKCILIKKTWNSPATSCASCDIVDIHFHLWRQR